MIFVDHAVYDCDFLSMCRFSSCMRSRVGTGPLLKWAAHAQPMPNGPWAGGRGLEMGPGGRAFFEMIMGGRAFGIIEMGAHLSIHAHQCVCSAAICQTSRQIFCQLKFPTLHFTSKVSLFFTPKHGF